MTTSTPQFDANGWCHDEAAAPVGVTLDVRMTCWSERDASLRTRKVWDGRWMGCHPNGTDLVLVWRYPLDPVLSDSEIAAARKEYEEPFG